MTPYADLRAKAGAVPSGPWRVDQSPPEAAAYIAAASPSVVLGLLDEIERLRDLVGNQRSRLYDAELITDEEYAALASDYAAKARLVGYREMRARLADARFLLRRVSEAWDNLASTAEMDPAALAADREHDAAHAAIKAALAAKEGAP